MDRGSLYNLANDFACHLTSVLNRTITNNAKIKAVVQEGSDGLQIPVGQGLTKRNAVPQLIPLRLANEAPTAWLDLIFQMRFDEHGKYLMVHSSYVAVCADEEGALELCHFDYERDKQHGYPEAHLQLNAASPALEKIGKASGRDSGPLAKLHFPVGGRRFRPSLEDVIEFLVVENLARPHKGWAEVVNQGRDDFQANQLRAAMRRRPDVVDEYLAEHGDAIGWQRKGSDVPEQRRGQKRRR